MSPPQQKFHEIVFQLLFSLDMGDNQEGGDLIPFIMRELSISKKVVREAYEQAKVLFARSEEADELIEATSKSYELERIGRVERNILRYALLGELSLSEALRLTTKFSTKEASTFVHALLESIDEKETSISPSDSSALE